MVERRDSVGYVKLSLPLKYAILISRYWDGATPTRNTSENKILIRSGRNCGSYSWNTTNSLRMIRPQRWPLKQLWQRWNPDRAG